MPNDISFGRVPRAPHPLLRARALHMCLVPFISALQLQTVPTTYLYIEGDYTYTAVDRLQLLI